MKNGLMVLLVISIVAAAAAGEDAPKPAHLFILSGQSNMAKLDPTLSFTPGVVKALEGERIIVVHDAQGGQPIRKWHKEWKPATGNRPVATGELYDRLMAKVKAAIEGVPLATVTFVWMQGERDAKEGHGDVYAASLKGLVAQLEKDLCHTDMAVVLGRLSDHGVDNPEMKHWNKVREVQVALAEASPRWEWVDTDDLNGPDNNLHYTRDGYRILGERFAEKAANLARPNKSPAPAISEP